MSTTPSRTWSSSWGALPPSCIAQNGCTLSVPPDASPTFLAHGIRKVLDGFATGGMKVCMRSVTSAAPAVPPKPASGSASTAAAAAASPVFLIVGSPFGSSSDKNTKPRPACKGGSSGEGMGVAAASAFEFAGPWPIPVMPELVPRGSGLIPAGREKLGLRRQSCTRPIPRLPGHEFRHNTPSVCCRHGPRRRSIHVLFSGVPPTKKKLVHGRDVLPTMAWSERRANFARIVKSNWRC